MGQFQSGCRAVTGDVSYWRLDVRLGRVLGYGNAFGVELGADCCGGGGGPHPPHFKRFPAPPRIQLKIREPMRKRAESRRSVIIVDFKDLTLDPLHQQGSGLEGGLRTHTKMAQSHRHVNETRNYPRLHTGDRRCDCENL